MKVQKLEDFIRRKVVVVQSGFVGHPHWTRGPTIGSAAKCISAVMSQLLFAYGRKCHP